MSSEADDMILRALQEHHGTTVITNPSEALIAVGRENTQLHEEMDRCHHELDLYRNALTVVAYLDQSMVGGVDNAFAKSQSLARAALAQILMGFDDLQLLRKVNERLRDERYGRQH